MDQEAVKDLRQKVADYWHISSYWNGRFELNTPVPSCSQMIRLLQKNLYRVGMCWRLGSAYANLLNEVISFGQKKMVLGDERQNVVQLKGNEGIPQKVIENQVAFYEQAIQIPQALEQ